MTSTGKGRYYGVQHLSGLRGKVGLPDITPASRVIANDTFWGGFPSTPTQIPYAWLTPPARFRSDPPRNVAQVTRTGGATARAVSAASVAAVGERPFTATLSSQVIADPAAYANWIVGNYTEPRRRMPQLRLNLLDRTPTELWRILGREIGDRISLTGAPGESRVLNRNPSFDVDVADWAGQTGATLSQVTTFSHNGNGSMAITPPGATATIGATTSHYAVLPSTAYVAAAWLFSLAGWPDGRTVIDWFTATGAFISTSGLGSAIAVPAGVWTLFSQTLTSPTNAASAALRVRQGGTPTAADVLYVDDATLTGPDGTVQPWPAGVTELVIEGITHTVAGDERYVVWNTAPLIGAVAGQAGPWFRADQSTTDIGSDVLAF